MSFKGFGAIWQISKVDFTPGYDMGSWWKIFTGFIYSSRYTIKVMFYNPGNFSNSTNYVKFLKKVPIIIKKCFIFCSNFFQYFFQINKKTLFKMATSTFRVSDHIFFICYLKHHINWFCDFWSKLIGYI